MRTHHPAPSSSFFLSALHFKHQNPAAEDMVAISYIVAIASALAFVAAAPVDAPAKGMQTMDKYSSK